MRAIISGGRGTGQTRAIHSPISSASRPALTPEQAHVTRMRSAAPNASGLYLASQYTASLSQAGRFVDAFGGALTYASPNIQASPRRVVEPASGMVYVSADGADDTAIGSATQTVAAYTAVFRSPPGQMTFGGNYASIVDRVDNGGYDDAMGYFTPGDTRFQEDNGHPRPRSVRRNGVALTSAFASLAPLTSFAVLTVYTGSPQRIATCALFSMYDRRIDLDLAVLILWPTDPSDSERNAAEAELASYYAPLLATNP